MGFVGNYLSRVKFTQVDLVALAAIVAALLLMYPLTKMRFPLMPADLIGDWECDIQNGELDLSIRARRIEVYRYGTQRGAQLMYVSSVQSAGATYYVHVERGVWSFVFTVTPAGMMYRDVPCEKVDA